MRLTLFWITQCKEKNSYGRNFRYSTRKYSAEYIGLVQAFPRRITHLLVGYAYCQAYCSWNE